MSSRTFSLEDSSTPHNFNYNLLTDRWTARRHLQLQASVSTATGHPQPCQAETSLEVNTILVYGVAIHSSPQTPEGTPWRRSHPGFLNSPRAPLLEARTASTVQLSPAVLLLALPTLPAPKPEGTHCLETCRGSPMLLVCPGWLSPWVSPSTP